MLHIQFQAPEPSRSDEEVFECFFYVFYGSNPGPSGS